MLTVKCIVGDVAILRKSLIDWLRIHAEPNTTKAIIVPSAATAMYVREIALQYPQTFMFCEVLTLPVLRSKLLQNEARTSLLSREDLALKFASLFPEHILEVDGILSEWIQLRRLGFSNHDFRSPYELLLDTYENTLNALKLRTLPQLDADLAKNARPLWDAACFFAFSAYDVDDTLLLSTFANMAKNVDFYALATGDSKLAHYWLRTVVGIDYNPKTIKKSHGKCQFYLAQTIIDEAAVMARQVIQYLNEGAPQVHVVLSDAGPLYQNIIAELADHDVVFYDGILGKNTPNKAQHAFAAWLRWQNNASNFIHFLTCLKNLNFLIDEINDLKFKKIYQKTILEALTLDDAIIRNMLVKEDPTVGNLLTQWPLLPTQGTVATYSQYIDKVLEHFNDELLNKKWQERRPLLEKLMPDTTCEKIWILKWLESLLSEAHVPHPKSASIFSPVRILSIVDALIQETDHIILGGLNATTRDNDYRWVDNVKIAGQYLPHSADKRALHNDTYALLLQRAHVTLTCSVQSPMDGSRGEVLPWVREHYFQTTGRSFEHMPILRYKKKTTVESDNLKAFDLFHRKRRNPNLPFGDFCFSPNNSLKLSCKAWEEALQKPAAAWFKYILKTQPQHTPLLPKVQIGTWTHAWVALNEGAFLTIPTMRLWLENLEQKAEYVRQRVRAAYATEQRVVPHLWQLCFNEALQNARAFVHSLKAAQGDCTHMWNEYAVENISVQKPFFEGNLNGRIDVALLKNIPDRDFIWIIDLKTGNDLPLSEKRLAKGIGLQLLLYGLAVQQLNYSNIQLSIAHKKCVLKSQIQLNDVATLGPWALLEDFQSGKWGNFGHMHSEYVHCGDFPIATLSIDPQILEAQWNLTHPHTQI